MILGAEIAMLVMGIILLARGKGLGKDAVAHWQYRLLGGFLLTLIPVAFVLVLILGIIWAITHPEIDPDKLAEAVRWPAAGLELVVIITYVVAGTLWEKAIKKKATSQG